MLGLPQPFGESQRVAAESYSILGDGTGIVQAILRVIAQTYHVCGIQPVFGGAATPVHTLWQRAIQQAVNNVKCDVADLAGLLSPLPLDVHGAMMKVVNSLPDTVITDIFLQKSQCNACKRQFEGIFVINGVGRQIPCQFCQNNDVKAICPAKLQIYRGQRMSCQMVQNGDTLALMAALARKNDRISALFSDFFAKNQYNFALSCPKSVQEALNIRDMTFLKSETAHEWLEAQNQRCQAMAGNLEIFIYFNMRYCASETVKHAVSDMYDNRAVTVDRPVEQPPPNSVQLDSQVVESQATPVLEQWRPPTQRKFVSELLITTPMLVLLGVALALLIINIVLLAILQNMKNGTMVLNNLDYSGQMNLNYQGVPVVANAPGVKEATLYSINTGSVYAPRLNASVASVSGLQSNCTYSDVLQLDGINLSAATIAPTSLVVNQLNVSNFTFTQQLQLQPGIDVGQLNIEALTAGQIRGNTLTSAGTFVVTAGATASDKVEATSITANTVQADSVTATGSADFNTFSATNLNTKDVTAQQAVQCNYSIGISGTAVLAAPRLDNVSSLKFEKDMVFDSKGADGATLPLALTFSSDLVFNATTNINSVTGAANIAINTSEAQNLECNSAPCDVTVPSVALSADITVNGNVAINNLTVSSFSGKDLSTNQVIVPSDSPLLPPRVTLNSSGLTTTLPVSIQQTYITPNSISFNPNETQATIPAISAENTNFTAGSIENGDALVATTKGLTLQTLNASSINLIGNVVEEQITISKNLTVQNMEAASVKGEMFFKKSADGPPCYDDPAATTCKLFVAGRLYSEEIWCDSICNAQTTQ